MRDFDATCLSASSSIERSAWGSKTPAGSRDLQPRAHQCLRHAIRHTAALIRNLPSLGIPKGVSLSEGWYELAP